MTEVDLRLRNEYVDGKWFQDEGEGKMNQIQDNIKSRHQHMFLWVLAGLLILRIPFLASIQLFEPGWNWADSVWQVGTYLLTTFLIRWELDNLAEYHIDTLAVMIIILFQPLQTLVLRDWGADNPLTFPKFPSLLIWGIAIVFVFAIRKDCSSLPKIQATSFLWFGVGMVAGLGTAILMGYPMSFLFPQGQYFMGPLTLFSKTTLLYIVARFVQQIGAAAVSEEPVFRGFLWGYLRKLGWKDSKIWIFQAALFTFAHIASLRWAPIHFWVIVPFGSLILGYLIWRSHTITSSLAAHGMSNAIGDTIGRLVAQYLR